MKKYNVYYIVKGYKSKRYCIVQAEDEKDAKLKAFPLIKKKLPTKRFFIDTAEESKGFYI